MVNNIIIFYTQILGLEVITWVNVEEVPATALCSRGKYFFSNLLISDTNDATTKN